MMHLRFPARLLSGALALSLLTLPAGALTVSEARSLLETHYIDPVPQEVLEQDSIQGMLDVLGDRYTQYFTPQEYHDFLASMEDTDIVGVGIVSQVADNGLCITNVIEGSPAALGGLLPGDVITAADGVSLAGMSSTQASELIRGAAGTSLTLSLLRAGEVLNVSLVRAPITVPSTSGTLLDGHVGYLDCSTFGPDTSGHFSEIVNRFDPEADHWIVDLRGNGGGVTTAAVDALGAFTGIKDMGYLRGRDGGISVFRSKFPALSIDPVIVLSDLYTASASELFSASVRDLEAGIVVGGRTFGKGVAQSLLDQDTLPDFFPDGDALKVTSHRYFAPRGTSTDTVGVIPHLLVPPELAQQTALLLSAPAPGGDTSGYYRLDLEWKWFIDRDMARQPEYRDAFEALLSAIPPTAQLWAGTGGPQGWTPVEPAELAAEAGVSYLDRTFSDTDESPFESSIDLLAIYGVLSGTGDGTFMPKSTLTRAQLCTLLAQALNCNVPTGESAFSDVPMDSWYGPSVNALADLGIVSGVGRGRFDPDAPVTHEQYFSIMGRLARRLNLGFAISAEQRPQDALNMVSLIPYSLWAREPVWLLSMSQENITGEPISLLWDEVQEIDPKAPTTREEAAELLCNFLIVTNILPIY